MSSPRLRDEISNLGGMLGDVIRQSHGQAALDLIEHIRTLSRDARLGDAGAALALRERIESLTLDEMRLVIRSFAVFLELANLAEDRERIRVLQDRTRAAAPNPRAESIRAAIGELKSKGLEPAAMQELIDRLDIELVLTAHPTEAKRRSVRSKLRSMREILFALDEDNPLQDRQHLESCLRSELVKLWQTDLMRPWRPSVLQEVQRGLAVAPTLWEVVPTLFDDLRHALEEAFPSDRFHVTPFLRYGSWIGGDRDGHPDVTVETTSRTLHWLRETALEFHLESCRRLQDSLSMSRKQAKVSDALIAAVRSARSTWPELVDRLAEIPPNEIYRRMLGMVRWRLEHTRDVRLDQGPPVGAYRTASELKRDIEIIAESICDAGTPVIADAEVQPWIDRIATFGLHFARLDVRQDSTVHVEVLDELFTDAGIADNYRELDEDARQELLIRTMGRPFSWSETRRSTQARETLALFRLLRRSARRFGLEALGGHVISMTRAPSDLLTVLWLWQWSASVDGVDPQDENLCLPIIPLYETVDDLAQAAQTTHKTLELPVYREYLSRLNDHQTVMVGYSDSTKDGGYLAACWALNRAQRSIHEVTERHGVRVTFFHGRGGSLGRGGGPAARSIRSLPSRTFNGSLRLTEQGEVLAERYDDAQIATRHLEQLAWSSLLSAADDQHEVDSAWVELMEELARRSRLAYRRLVDHRGFVEFFRSVTPIQEIEQLPIGSRPARRQGGQGLSDLRAIPWVFSWTQIRGIIPAWFGMGTAVKGLLEESPDAAAHLTRMYREWPFVQAWVDNASLALAKADLGVFTRYAELADDGALSHALADEIAEEYTKSCEALCLITEREELLGNVQWLAESIRVRNRYVDPLNLIQIEVLRQARGVEDDEKRSDEFRQLIRLSIKGVAAGMRTTG